MAPRSRSALKNVRSADQRRMAEANAGKDWSQTRNQRRVKWFAVGIGLLVLAAIGGWFAVASQVDAALEREIEALNTPTQTVRCDGREIVGFPFRMGLKCDAVAFTSVQEGVSVQAGTLRTAAQVYAPRHQIIELSGPLTVQTATTLPLTVDWDSARSSVRLANNNTLRRTVLEVQSITASTSVGEAPLQRLVSLDRLFSVAEPYAAQADGTATDLRFYLQADAISLSGLSGPPLNFEGTLALMDGAFALADMDAWLASLPSLSEPIRLENIRVRNGAMLIEMSGRLDMSEQGLLNGTLRVAGQGLEEGLSALQAGIDPRATAMKQTMDTLVPTILALAQPDPDNPKIRRAPPITIRDGSVLLGFIPIGDIPAIELPD